MEDEDPVWARCASCVKGAASCKGKRETSKSAAVIRLSLGLTWKFGCWKPVQPRRKQPTGLCSECLIPIKCIGRAGRDVAALQQGMFPVDNVISN